MKNDSVKLGIDILFSRYLIATSLIVSLLTFVVSLTYQFYVEKASREKAVESVADTLAKTLREGLETGDLWTVRKTINSVLATNIVDRFQITPKDDAQSETIIPFLPEEMRADLDAQPRVTRTIESNDSSRVWQMRMYFSYPKLFRFEANSMGAPRFGRRITADLNYLKKKVEEINFLQPVQYNNEEISTIEVEHALVGVAKTSESLVGTYQKNKKLERAEAVGRLAKQVSHDIRSPVGALEMAVKGLRSDDSERLVLIRAATKRINDIANDLLKASKPAPIEIFDFV